MSSESTTNDSPENNKYLAEVPLEHDKDRLYQLYWGYGLSAMEIRARCKRDVNIKRYMSNMGIPTREFWDHRDWQPHHGVPPMFEWPSTDDEDDSTDRKQNLWRQPTTDD